MCVNATLRDARERALSNVRVVNFRLRKKTPLPNAAARSER